MADQVGIVTFPGSNGDHDAIFAFRHNLGVSVRVIDYRETNLDGVDAVVLPGGFSYGGHLRCGAIARFAPVMAPLRMFAERGGPVLGICNGFQILTEAHLLPGALLRNKTLQFHCHWTHIQIEQRDTAWTNQCGDGQGLRLPVAHGDGAYFADAATLERVEGEGRVIARYRAAPNDISQEFVSTGNNRVAGPESFNPNGSLNRIAGVANARGNVVGLMPHPERAADPLVGGVDGLSILRSGLAAIHAAL
jgi:phosphoribosylformylglycinamidine synthase